MVFRAHRINEDSNKHTSVAVHHFKHVGLCTERKRDIGRNDKVFCPNIFYGKYFLPCEWRMAKSLAISQNISNNQETECICNRWHENRLLFSGQNARRRMSMNANLSENQLLFCCLLWHFCSCSSMNKGLTFGVSRAARRYRPTILFHFFCIPIFFPDRVWGLADRWTPTIQSEMSLPYILYVNRSMNRRSTRRLFRAFFFFVSQSPFIG